MLRRVTRSVVAHGLGRLGAARALGRLSGVGQEPLILGYHRVVPDGSAAATHGVPGMAIRVSTLERQLELVGRRFRFVSLDELGERLDAGSAAGLAAVTFDDGYVDFYENAFPLLQRKGVPAAVFVCSGLVDDAAGFLHDRLYAALETALGRWGAGRVSAYLRRQGFAVARLPEGAFPATRTLLGSLDQEALAGICGALEREFGAGVPAPRSLTWDELGRMSRAGLTVASHSRTHALLTRESAARVLEETAASRLEIETRIGVRTLHFAYPDGCFDAAAVRAVAEAGYRYGYTGCRHRDPDNPMLTLPRRVLWEGSTRGALGGFSADVLSCQIDGIFDRADPCRGEHGAGPRPRGATAVAVVAPSLDVPGGQSVQAAALVEGLGHDGYAVEFVASNPRFPAGLGWIRRLPVARTLLNQALYAASLLRLRRADVVQIFSAAYWSFLLAPAPALVVARAFGKRTVLNYHSGEAEQHLGRWGWLVHPWLHLAHEIVVPSEYLRRIFARYGYRARVVRNVVDVSRFAYRARTPLQPRLLSTRSLEPSYGVDVVLRAFGLVRSERPGATLTVAGGGSEEGRLRRIADGLGGVTFVGRVSPEAMPAVCASADVFLNASVVDNQPLSLLEAFASGLPVVTTATGGIAGMVRHGVSGLVVPPLDPVAMATAVLVLLRDEAAALRIARRARRLAETHTWTAVRAQWAEVYAGGSADAAPLAGDGDRRGGGQEPPGSLEMAGEEGHEHAIVTSAG